MELVLLIGAFVAFVAAAWLGNQRIGWAGAAAWVLTTFVGRL